MFEFSPEVTADGSLSVAARRLGSNKSFSLILTARDLKRLSRIKIKNPAALKTSLLQGVVAAQVLQDQAILNRLALDEQSNQCPVMVKFSLSAFEKISRCQLASQIGLQVLRLARHHRARYGRNVSFCFYGSPNEEILSAARLAVEPYGDFMQLTEDASENAVVLCRL